MSTNEESKNLLKNERLEEPLRSRSVRRQIRPGRQELFTQVTFPAVVGLQKKESTLNENFPSYAAELNVVGHPELSEQEKQKMSSKASTIILEEIEFDAHVVTLPLAFAIVVATGSQFLVGYNTGVMNAPEKVVFPGHSTGLWSLAVAAFAVGGPFGAMAGGKLADSRGRRGALLIDTWTFLMGGLLQTFAPDMYTIILSRFIIGFASGFSSVLVPIYLGELAPPTLRGMLGTLTQFALVIGIFVANVLAFPFATEGAWRKLFAVTPIVAIAQLLFSPCLLESPRWLLNRDPNSNLARHIIKNLRGLRHDSEVEHEIGNYIIGEAAQHQEEAKSQYTIISEMVTHRKIRMLLFSSLFLQMAQQFSGINAVFYYSTSFFEGVIDNPLAGTTIVTGVNVVVTYVAMLLMDRCGRKTLILWSSGGMLIACVILILSLLDVFNNILALVAVIMYVAFFAIGLGPIPWLIVAEMFEGKYVATAMSLCCQLNWACNFIIGLVFPYMNQYLGPYSFGPFAVVIATTFFYALFVLPETQGTKPEDLIAQIVRRNSESVIYEANPDPGAIELALL
jgi:SP family facilitated glucose transporter-like MFS transporter 3